MHSNNVEDRDVINDVAIITILSLLANLHMGKNPPEEYFNRNYVGVDKIKKHFVSTDPELWTVQKYLDLLEERRKMLVDGISKYLAGLGLMDVERELRKEKEEENKKNSRRARENGK